LSSVLVRWGVGGGTQPTTTTTHPKNQPSTNGCHSGDHPLRVVVYRDITHTWYYCRGSPDSQVLLAHNVNHSFTSCETQRIVVFSL